MATVIHRQDGWSTAGPLATQLINDLKNNGFSLKYVNAGTIADEPCTATIATLEAGSNVDPLAAAQPWRIQIDGSVTGTITVYTGTALQLPDDQPRSGTPTAVNIASTAILTPLRLCNYNLVITPRGVFIRIYTQGEAYGYMGFICVQRLVDRLTGETVITGTSPVFALSVVAAATLSVLQRHVVRESDVLVPTACVDLTAVGPGSIYAYNLAAAQPPSLDKYSNYILTPFTGLATSRTVYLDDLDMMLIAPAVGFNDASPVSLTAYGGNRTYTATRGASGNTANCSSFLFLTSGGGID